MKPDYLPSYGVWGDYIQFGSPSDYEIYRFRKKQAARERDIAIKRRKARQQRQKIKRHNWRNK